MQKLRSALTAVALLFLHYDANIKIKIDYNVITCESFSF